MSARAEERQENADLAAEPCPVCGGAQHACVCPPCAVCGRVGDEACYREHGMTRNERQVASLSAFDMQCRIELLEDHIADNGGGDMPDVRMELAKCVSMRQKLLMSLRRHPPKLLRRIH